MTLKNEDASIARWVARLDGEAFKLVQQKSHSIEGRIVDELIFSSTKTNGPEWTREQRFCFDITAGFHNLA